MIRNGAGISQIRTVETDGVVRFLSRFVSVKRHTLSHRNKSVNLTAWPVHVTNLALAMHRSMLEASSAMKKPVKQKRWRDATIAIHQGAEHFHVAAPAGTTIARTANFTFESTEEMKRGAEGKSWAYIYPRYGNPTLPIAEETRAPL